MWRCLKMAILLVPAASVLGQSSTSQPFQPAVPAASSFNSFAGGWWGGTPGGATVEGSMMQGMASVISAQGDYNLATSAAAVNLTQARKQDIQNRQAATHAYFEMRETNKAYVEANRPRRLSQEQLVRIAADAAPRQLDANEVDPVSGRLTWPDLLQGQQFAEERGTVERLMAKRAQYGTLGVSDREQAGQAIETLSQKLRELIQRVPAQQYMDSKNFLRSLSFGLNRSQIS